LAPGPIEHTLSIKNESGIAVDLPRQLSAAWTFRGQSGHALQAWWIEKAAGRPSNTGVHAMPMGRGFGYTVLSEPYESDERAYSKDWRARDAVPWLAVYDPKSRSGWYSGIEFSGRVSYDLHALGKNRFAVAAGLAKEPVGCPDFHTLLAPGETYSLPTIFVGCFRGDIDDSCNQLRHWVSSALRPKIKDKRYPLLTLNSWGSGMAVDSKLATTMMHEGAGLGIEQFHIDAGWFKGVGDWRANPAKFPEGIAAMSAEAHKLGMRFGLWTGWTQGGTDNEDEAPAWILNVRSPTRRDWFGHDVDAAWKPADFVGTDVCLGDPAAVAWCTNLLTNLVKDYHLDMLEHDQRMVVSDCSRADHLHTESHGDIAYRAALGYYKVYDALRAAYPDLMFEDCVNGGRMVDYGVVKRVSYISIVDSYDPLSNRRAIYDLTYVLPSSMCECYVMAMPVKNLDEFRAMLRSGLMGWCSMMQDPAKWTADQKLAASQEFAFYKSFLRPLILKGNVYHVSPRPDGVHWDGLEYASQDSNSAALYAFNGTDGSTTHLFKLKGLVPKSRYLVQFQGHSQESRWATGSQLMGHGLEVKLMRPSISSLVTLVAR
jgi:alpha-galactosidase